MNKNAKHDGPAQIPAGEREDDRALIRQLVTDAERFQNRPEKFVQLLSEDAYLVNVVGFRVEGRDEVYEIMSAAIKTSLSDITIKHEIFDIQFLKKDAALVKCIKYIYAGNESRSGKERSKAVLTFVVTKNSEKWLISSIQNTLIKEKAIQNIRSLDIQSSDKHMDSVEG